MSLQVHRGLRDTVLVVARLSDVGNNPASAFGRRDHRDPGNSPSEERTLLIDNDAALCARICCGIVVPPDARGLVQRFGQIHRVLPPGRYYVLPWDHVQLLSLKRTVFGYQVKDAITKDNVILEVDVLAVFHIQPTDDGVVGFVYGCGPAHLTQLLRLYLSDLVKARIRAFGVMELLSDDGLSSLAHGVGVDGGDVVDSGLQRPAKSTPASGGSACTSNDSPWLDNGRQGLNDRLRNFHVAVDVLSVVQLRAPPVLEQALRNARQERS